MSIKIAYNGAAINKPGAYSKIDVEVNAGLPLTPAGIVGIVGEAYGGAPGSSDGVQEFDSTQLYDIVTKYVSGPIVDAARVLINPSRDPDIANGANKIKIYKTNSSVQSSSYVNQIDDAAVLGHKLNLTSANYGADENNINFYITQGVTTDDHCAYISDALTFPLALTPGGVLTFIFKGSNYAFTTPAGGPYADIDAVLAVLNNNANWAPSRPVVFTAYDSTHIKCELNVALAAFDGFESMHEYGYAFLGGLIADAELKFRTNVLFSGNGTAAGTFQVNDISSLAVGMWTQVMDNDTGAVFVKITDISGSAAPYTITCNDGAINLSAYTVAQNARTWGACSIVNESTLQVTKGNGGWTRGARGSRLFVAKKNTILETLPENANDVLFRILYVGAGSTCAFNIKSVGGVKKLTTVCSGAAGDNLDITLSTYTTVQQLVDYISNFGGGAKYVCYSDYYNAGSYNPTYLDFYDTIDCRAFPLEVKAAVQETATILNTYSQFLRATIVDNVYGQMETISSSAKRFLSGASNGGTSNSNVQAGFDALLNSECNIVVPLFSRDASSDIAESLTEATSTYTVLSIIAMADAHCRTGSNTLNRSERTCFVSYKGSYADTKQAAKLLNSEYSSMCLQDVYVTDSTDNIVWKNPHIFAALAAGAEAGAEVGLPLTRKQLNCYGVRHSTFNPKTQYADAIDAGLFFAEQPEKGGVVVVCGNTTYQKDASFVWNRRSVIRAAHYVAKTMRDQLETAFVGKTKAGGTTMANSIKSYAQTILGSLLRANILVADARNKGLGYRNLVVNINGGIVTVSVIITPVQGIDFVLNDITLANISDVA